MVRDEQSRSDVWKVGALCHRDLRSRRFGAAAKKKRGSGLVEAEGRRVRPGTGHGKTCFENPQRNERLLEQRCGGGGDGGGPAAAARAPQASPRREGRPPPPLPPPSGFFAPRHSKLGERRFLTAFPGAPPVLPGSPAPRRCRPPLPSPAHRTRPVSEIHGWYPPASLGFLEVMGAGG